MSSSPLSSFREASPPLAQDFEPSAPAPASRLWVHLLLLAATCVTTLVAGFFLQVQFAATSEQELIRRVSGLLSNPLDILAGAPFAVAILAILISHEMGHYLACRHYRIQASLPYLLPAPPPLMPFGTFGAVIRIRSMFLDRRQLFDVGVAGPLAGFVVTLPALALGLALSTEFQPIEELGVTLEFGEPLLFQAAAALFFPGDSILINLHPIGWAAWFGMLATSLNLLPVGQLDGGHIVYAWLGRRAHRILSWVTFLALAGLSALSWPMTGYLFFALVLLVMRFRHPPPLFEEKQLDPRRLLLALAACAIFAVTFIPIPIQMVEHIGSL